MLALRYAESKKHRTSSPPHVATTSKLRTMLTFNFNELKSRLKHAYKLTFNAGPFI